MRRIIGLALSALTVPVLLFSRATAAPMFGTPVNVGSNPNATFGEPGIDIADNGYVFVNGPNGLPLNRSSVYRSTNGGASFSRIPVPIPHGQQPGGGDGDLAVKGNRVYFLDLWAGSNSFFRSDNYGQSWAFSSPLSSLALSDRQWIAVGGPGSLPGTDTLYIVYALIQPPRWVMLAKSTDSGLTWTTHKVAPSLYAATGFTGQLVADDTGYVGFIYEESGGRIHYAYSTNSGEQWTQRDIATGASDDMTSVALDGSNLYATWIRKADWAVMESHSTDFGDTWSTPQVISSGGTNIFSWIDTRGGKTALAWYGTDGGVVVPDNNNGPWHVKYSESLDGGATYTAPVVAASTVKTNPICTMGLGCPGIDGNGNRELLDFMQLAIDASGKSLLTYVHVPAPGVSITKVVKQL